MTMSLKMSDDFDRLTDDALFDCLADRARESGMRLVVKRRDSEWLAESRAHSGLGGEMVAMTANGSDRRTAMLRLSDQFAK
jgi:hypothetical protein